MLSYVVKIFNIRRITTMAKEKAHIIAMKMECQLVMLSQYLMLTAILR